MIQVFIMGVGVACFALGLFIGVWMTRSFELRASDQRPRCQNDGLSYNSFPPQYRCRHCHEFWIQGERAPVCAISPCPS